MVWMVRGQWEKEMAAWLVFLFAVSCVSCHVSDFTWMDGARAKTVFWRPFVLALHARLWNQLFWMQ